MRGVRRLEDTEMLAKPRRWLAYSIEVNDRLGCYDTLVDRFEQSDVPLDGAFGSNTEQGYEVPGILVAVGRAVEPARLWEVLELLGGLGRLFLCIDEGVTHNKFIAVGSLNLGKVPIVALSEELSTLIARPGTTAEELQQAVDSAPPVHVFGARDGRE
jgi:hypothetical protein